ncbi:MAG: hypothetical protein ABJB55_09210 [Actinomycetota bacterium]
MDTEALGSYLNDHLAGSEVGLRTAERLAAELEDGGDGFLSHLCEEIRDEQALLRTTLDRLELDESLLKRSAGVAGGVLGWVRDAVPIGDTPTTLEDLEALAVGVWGKRLLWGTLARVAAHDERFADLDVDGLAARAEDQERALLGLRADQIEQSLRLGEPA